MYNVKLTHNIQRMSIVRWENVGEYVREQSGSVDVVCTVYWIDPENERNRVVL
jgi:hypothetical protein